MLNFTVFLINFSENSLLHFSLRIIVLEHCFYDCYIILSIFSTLYFCPLCICASLSHCRINVFLLFNICYTTSYYRLFFHSFLHLAYYHYWCVKSIPSVVLGSSYLSEKLPQEYSVLTANFLTSVPCLTDQHL